MRSIKIWFYSGRERKLRVGTNTTPHKDLRLHWLSKIKCCHSQRPFSSSIYRSNTWMTRRPEYYCFLDGYSGYNQIPTAPEDQEKISFTYPFGTFAYRWIPFGLCNNPVIFQRCILSLFSDMVERFLEIFMDDFSIYGDSFNQCLHHLELVLKRCAKKILTLN